MASITSLLRAFSLAGVMGLPQAAQAQSFSLSNPQYVAIVKAREAIVRWSPPTATAEEAEKSARDSCELEIKKRDQAGNFTPTTCYTDMIISNAAGFSCAVVFQNNVVRNVNAYVIGAASERDAVSMAQNFVARNKSYSNRLYPQATAHLICIGRDGKTKTRDIAYSIARP